MNALLTQYWRWFQVLSIAKIVNLLRCYSSFYLSKWFKKQRINHLPYTLSFEPTTTCNLSCPECPSGLKSFTRPTGMSPLVVYTNVLEDVKHHLIFLYLYFQGEPFLHKDFIEMIRLAKDRRLFTITSTNGHFLTKSKCIEIVESGLDRLIISMDGSTQETYEAYRKDGNLKKVIQGIEQLVATKRERKAQHPYIVLQMLVVAPNEHQTEEVRAIGTSLGVDEVVFKTAQIYDFKNGHPLIPTKDLYSRYRKSSDGTWEIKNKLENQCWKMWHSAVSTWDGKIIPCCFDKDAQYEMGNITQKSFKEIWFHANYQAFRNAILHSRKNIDICQNCSEGTKVWETV